MYVSVWDFQVSVESAPAFERMYGPGGEWVRLFRRSDGYIRTDLLLDLDRPNHYVVEDYWTSRGAFDEFLDLHRADYEALDRQCEGLTEQERSLGSFLCLSDGIL